MPRSAPPATPGEDPKPETVLTDAEAAQVGEALTDSTLRAEVAEDENKTLAEQVSMLMAREKLRDAEMEAMRKQVGRVQAEQEPPEPVKLPKYEDKLKDLKAGKLETPELTDKGWIVPPTLPIPSKV